MLEIVVTVCAIANPFKCADHAITPAVPFTSSMHCAFTGQADVAAWLSQNPEYIVREYRCRTRSFAAK